MIGLVGVALILSCSSDYATLKETLPPKVEETAAGSDARPAYLSVESPRFPAPVLRQEAAFRLLDREGNPTPRLTGLSVARGRLYALDFSARRVYAFDSDGTYRFECTHADFENRLIRPVDVAFSPTLRRIVVTASGKQLYLFHESGEFDRLLALAGGESLPQYPEASIPSADGDLLLVMGSQVREPYLALLRDGSLVRRFHQDRTPHLPLDEDFRYLFRPIVNADTDADGNIYSTEGVDYEIRKYDREGNYLGDFRLLEDPDYEHPPARFDMERFKVDEEYRTTWTASWSQVYSLAVIDNRYVVVCLKTYRGAPYKLHFYTLAGQSCASPVSWPSGLMCTDERGRLYFYDDHAQPPIVSVWSIGEDTDDPEMAR